MRPSARSIHAAVLLLGMAFATHGAELVVRVEGLPAAEGTVSCGLFTGAAGP